MNVLVIFYHLFSIVSSIFYITLHIVIFLLPRKWAVCSTIFIILQNAFKNLSNASGFKLSIRTFPTVFCHCIHRSFPVLFFLREISGRDSIWQSELYINPESDLFNNHTGIWNIFLWRKQFFIIRTGTFPYFDYLCNV